MPVPLCAHEAIMSVHLPYMNLLKSIMCPGKLVNIHSTLLSHGSDKICLLHCTSMTNCTSTVVYILTLHYCTHPSKIKKKTNIYLPY